MSNCPVCGSEFIVVKTETLSNGVDRSFEKQRCSCNLMSLPKKSFFRGEVL